MRPDLPHPLRFALAGLALAGAAMGSVGCGGSTDGFSVAEADDAPADYSFVIPAGSGEAIDAGEPLDLLPARMDVGVGEVIEIVNEDERGHLVGPFFVGANETIRHTFTAPGEFQGECSVHSSGQIVISVT